MAKKLIIAEKPSVANDIARTLGGFTRHGDYYENRDYVLSSAIGHLLELVPPEGVEVKRGKWSFAHLPVIPPHFDLKPIERTEERLELLVKLLRRKAVFTRPPSAGCRHRRSQFSSSARIVYAVSRRATIGKSTPRLPLRPESTPVAGSTRTFKRKKRIPRQNPSGCGRRSRLPPS